MAKQASRQVSVFLNGQQVETTVKNITSAMTEANNRLAKMVVGSDAYIQQLEEVKRYKSALIEHNNALKGVSQGWSLMKSGADKYIGIAAGAFAVDNILSAGKALFTTGAQMEALTKKARTVFGEALPQITAEAEKNARAMGLTTQEYISAAAAAQDLLVPMGFQRKEAADISAQLVNLSGALSEWTGGTKSAKEVNDTLTKALLGEREELKSLGIAISEADVKAQLAAKGADKLTGSALEQAKAMATLELILAKSTDAQAQFATGSDSVVRRQAEASAKLAEIGEKLATLFLPVFERLLAIGGDVIDFFGGLVDGVSALVDPAEAATKAFNEQASKVADLETNIAPLLDRYDELSTKTNLSAAEQEELRSIVDQVTKVVPSAATAFDEYGRALGLNTEAAREFIRVEKARLQFVNQEAVKAIDKQIASLEKQAEVEKRLLDTRTKLVTENANNINAQIVRVAATDSDIAQAQARLSELQNQIAGARAETARLKGDTLSVPEPAKTQTGSTTTSGGGKPSGPKKPTEGPDNFEARLAIAAESLKKIRELVAAESQAQQDAFDASQQYILDATVATKEAQALIELNYDDEKNAAAEQVRVALLSDRELELEALQEHYNQLLFIAETYGLDTAALKQKQAEEIAALEKKYADKAIQDQQEAQKARLAAIQSTFQEFGNLVSATFDLLGAEGEKAAGFQKIATLAKIAFDTAAAISSLVAASEANPTNSLTFGAAGIIQYVAGLARILGNMAQAKKILQAAPTVKQKAGGGYLDVIGDNDGRQYNARVINRPSTGLLPNYPVLFHSATDQPVLASERGSEYFVSAESLRNPYIANYVRMIDNMTRTGGRVSQFAEGGATSTATTPPSAPIDKGNQKLEQLLEALLNTLSGGITAVVPDQTVVGIKQRFDKINGASGGYYQ